MAFTRPRCVLADTALPHPEEAAEAPEETDSRQPGGCYRPVRKAISQFQGEEKTLPEVCEALNAAGFRTRTGLPFRHSVQIIKIVRRFPEEAH